MTYRQIDFTTEIRFPGKLGVQTPGLTRNLRDVDAEPTRDGLVFDLMIGADAVKQVVPWAQVARALWLPKK